MKYIGLFHMCNLIVCICLLSFLPLPFFPSVKVLLMQESLRRIIETEESRMGEISYIVGTGLSRNNVFKQVVELFDSRTF